MDVIVCSKCMGVMQSVERSGIVIERCTQCGGVHLDRGELERLIEAERAYLNRRSGSWDDDRPAEAHDAHRYKKRKKQKKLEGFLEELFDF